MFFEYFELIHRFIYVRRYNIIKDCLKNDLDYIIEAKIEILDQGVQHI